MSLIMSLKQREEDTLFKTLRTWMKNSSLVTSGSLLGSGAYEPKVW